MRENKFCYWDPFNETMHYSGEKLSDFFLMFEAAKDSGNDPKLTEFTGLFDKSGKEIYEGDIIATRWGRGLVEERPGVFIVRFAAMSVLLYSVAEPPGGIDTKCSILGNQFETPELLPELPEAK